MMDFYEQQERRTNAKQHSLVEEVKALLSKGLVEAEAASKELHQRSDIEPAFAQRWDEAIVKALRVWKEHFDTGLWRRVVGAVAQLSRQMDYYPTHDLSNGASLDALVTALTLKAYELRDIQFEQ